MIRALYFGLCWCLAFLGVVIAIHIHFGIGISISILFLIKFFLMKEGLI
jgi:hypothetical protein